MANETKAAELEAAIRELTRPINGQYPRPWITNSKDPASSEVFVVGMNDAKTFPVNKVGSHVRFLNALFNRGGEDCYDLYYQITCGPYYTRDNLDSLIIRLKKGVTDVLSTNVICYSTPMSRDLRDSSHAGGAARGREIFKAVFEIIEPQVMIVHGSRTVKELTKSFRIKFLKLPDKDARKPVEAKLGRTSVFLIPSLAPPGFNKWSSWRDKHLKHLCRVVARRLA